MAIDKSELTKESYRLFQDFGMQGVAWHTRKDFDSIEDAKEYIEAVKEATGGAMPTYRLFRYVGDIQQEDVALYFMGRWRTINPLRYESPIMERYLAKQRGEVIG